MIEVDSLASGRKSQTVVLNLGLSAAGQVTDAAFVMPVPGPAQFELADSELFLALDTASAPEVRYEVEHYFDPFPFFPSAAPSRSRASGAVVTNRVVLGPYDIVSLAGSDSAAVRDWLEEHHFELSADLGAGLGEYLAKGWQIVAVKLTAEDGLRGVLPPMRIAFLSDEIVYPMRLSARAQGQQQFRVYVLADHRAAITNPTPAGAAPSETFAGWVRSEDAPAFQSEFSGQRFLTRYDQELRPEADMADIRVEAAADDTPFRAVVHVVRRQPWSWGPWLSCGILFALPLLLGLGSFLTARRGLPRAAS